MELIDKTISHYHIFDKLGEGGMGIVYKAEDTKLKRTVALKFLPPELTRDPEAKQRFIHEAQAASTLQHTNICTIHDIDEDEDGQLFIVMDYYEGESLKEKTARGPIKLDKVLDIAIQVAGGLAKAHQKGIVHRDIKPENILITTDGIVKILDFGVAKLTNQSGITRTGSTIGTAAYMSPEQAQGLVVDHRADIWSLGVVLYEMLTGRLPFRDEYEAALLYSIVHEEYPGIPGLRSDIPPGVVSLIDKSLQKDRSHRYQTTVEMIKDLKSAMEPVAASSNHEKSIVVLPFENLSSDPEQEYFSDGLTEEIITDLSHVHDLLVISRSSAMTLKGSKRTIPDIARQLNVQYVLEGSVRKAGNSLRITGQLIDASNDTHLWAEKYSGTLDDVFDIQEKVSQSIVESLSIKLTTHNDRIIKGHRIRNADAFDHYLRARDQIHKFSIKALNRAVDYLKQAQSETGENAAILSGLAYAYAQYVNLGYEQDEYIKRAESLARRALKLNPDSHEALTVLGFVGLWFQGKPFEAIRYLEQSIKLCPDDFNTLLWLAAAYAQVGRVRDALDVATRAIRVDPLTPLGYGLIGAIEIYAGHLNSASNYLEKTLAEEAGNPMLQMFFSIVLFYRKNFKRLSEFVASVTSQKHETATDLMMIILSKAVARQSDKMHILLRETEVMTTFRRDPQFSWFLASAFACAGDSNAAFDWLGNAVDRGFLNWEVITKHDPFLSKLSTEPRFKKIVERIKSERQTSKIKV